MIKKNSSCAYLASAFDPNCLLPELKMYTEKKKREVWLNDFVEEAGCDETLKKKRCKVRQCFA